jgi:hypothetical protein
MRRRRPATTETWDDIWQRRATADAIVSMRKSFEEGNIPPGTPVGNLTDHELGWLHAMGLFAWIRSRSVQATANGWSTEEALRITNLEPQPWDVGAALHVLPEIGALPDLDWSKPLSAWSKDEMAGFLVEASKLIRAAMIARDVGGGITNPGSLDQAPPPATEPNGALAIADQFNEPPFTL